MGQVISEANADLNKQITLINPDAVNAENL